MSNTNTSQPESTEFNFVKTPNFDARSIPPDVIRQWAQENNFQIGSRGRIPQEVVQAFKAAIVPAPSSPAFGGSDSLEPLVDYLEPEFGIVYEYDGDYKPLWVDGLQKAVKRYLIDVIPDDLYDKTTNYLLRLPPEGTRAEQVDFIVQNESAFDIAQAVHAATVESLPSLDALIGGLESWEGHMELATDAGLWLTAHATEAQLTKLNRILGTTAPIEYELEGYALDGSLSPQRLLELWHTFGECPPVDMTDEEWRLLKAFLSNNKKAFHRSSEAQTRKAVDGMAYRFTHNVSWSNVPERYGNSTNIRQRYYYTYRLDVFPKALEALCDNPQAARLVAWVKKATAGDLQKTDYNQEQGD